MTPRHQEALYLVGHHQVGLIPETFGPPMSAFIKSLHAFLCHGSLRRKEIAILGVRGTQLKTCGPFKR